MAIIALFKLSSVKVAAFIEIVFISLTVFATGFVSVAVLTGYSFCLIIYEKGEGLFMMLLIYLYGWYIIF